MAVKHGCDLRKMRVSEKALASWRWPWDIRKTARLMYVEKKLKPDATGETTLHGMTGAFLVPK